MSCSTFETKQETVQELTLITGLEPLENNDSIDVHTVKRMEEVKSLLQEIRNKQMEDTAIKS